MTNSFPGKSPSIVSDHHLRAIGAVIVNWSMLEIIMETAILGLYEITPDRGLVITNNLGFQSKLTILRILALNGAIKDKDQARKWTALLQRIELTAPKRNHIAHGIWGGSQVQGIATRHSISVRGKRLRTKVEKVPLSEIEGASNEILDLISEFRQLAQDAKALPEMPGVDTPRS